MGGIVTDSRGETCLEGLFAVGETAAGAHGANRLGGNALAEIFSMGSLAGDRAGKRARQMEPLSVSETAFGNERARLEGAYCDRGVSVKQLVKELKWLMWRKAGVIRRQGGLEEALDCLRQPLPRTAVSSPTDLVRLMEYRNMRCVAQMICLAALERTESRGSHYRSDFPKENNRTWLKNITLKITGAGPGIETTPASLDRVRP
jgi:succinate dehydrogenase/fumarate reductase flavoprotein subunit